MPPAQVHLLKPAIKSKDILLFSEHSTLQTTK
jgi:hypothetical protein